MSPSAALYDVAEGQEDEQRAAGFPRHRLLAASVQTDATGQATVEIPLPDNLTTWRLTARR